MKRQSRSFADGSERDPSVVCEAVKRETGPDGLNIADNVSQVRFEIEIGDQIFELSSNGNVGESVIVH